MSILTQIFGPSMQWYWQQKTSVQLLDPMTTLVRVALLKFMPPGTLIRFHQNRIVYDGPGLLQGIQRDYAKWCGQSASKEDLHNLLPPLLRACEWFSAEEHNQLFQYAIDGLQALQSTYRKKRAFQTCDAIRSYIRLLHDTMGGRHLAKQEFKDLMEASVQEPLVQIVGGGARMGDMESPTQIRHAAASAYMVQDRKPVIDLSAFWSVRQIRIVQLLLEEVCERSEHKVPYHTVIESVERLLNDKEVLLVEKIAHACTAV